MRACWPTQAISFKKNVSTFPQSHQLSIALLFEVRAHNRMLIGLILCGSCSANNSYKFMSPWTCHVQKTLFCSGPLGLWCFYTSSQHLLYSRWSQGPIQSQHGSFYSSHSSIASPPECFQMLSLPTTDTSLPQRSQTPPRLLVWETLGI